MHTHSAPPAKRFQKIVEPALTQRHSDALTSVVRSSGDVFCRYIKTRRTTILPQKALRRDCNGKCIEWIESHYLEVVVEV